MKSLIKSVFRAFGRKSNEEAKTIADYNREAMVKLGADQFKKLIEKGLTVPVALS